MPTDSSQRVGDLVLAPGSFAQVLDTTKGVVSVYTGPIKTSLSDNDQLVVWLDGEFIETGRGEAIQQFTRANEGQYVVLHNPIKGENKFPTDGARSDAIELDNGRKVVIPGPISFPLWPGQTAQVLDGHHLRNNQYLLVRVYEPDQAKANAEAAVVARAGRGEGEGEKVKAKKAEAIEYTMGKLMVIEGTDVSYYIPPTGIEVVPDPNHAEEPYVRGAVTLQRLEYCILLNENGDKRYVYGPDVVFPKPTEIFQTDGDSTKKRFEMVQLNPQSGLYIKVIAAYEEDGKAFAAGEERFVTGKDTPIYKPRPEESIIAYGEQKGDERKHHAIAIPKGEGRYVLERTKGSVDLVEGPEMFLPDPRTQVIIRRIIEPDLCEVMYPGNEEALQANANFAEEGWQLSNMMAEERTRGLMSPPTGASYYAGISSAPPAVQASMAQATQDSLEQRQGGMRARSAKRAESGTQDILRSTSYKKPRTIVLATKYEGAVKMRVYSGYAIMLVNSTGDRRVIIGPRPVLLDYDETPMVLSLSTGRPKNGDNRLATCYLRTVNNAVSDRVTVETRDLVPFTIDLAYRVNFEGEPTKWFDLENYVKVLTDHNRSKLRNLAKRYEYQEFLDKTTDLIRDHLLGPVRSGKKEAEEGEHGRPGLTFDENGMHMTEVEVLKVQVNNQAIQGLSQEAMYNALKGAIRLAETETRTQQDARIEELTREALDAKEQTQVKQAQLRAEAISRSLAQRLQEVGAELEVGQHNQEVAALTRAESKAEAEQELALERAHSELVLSTMQEEVKQWVERTNAVSPDLVKAITVFGDQRVTEQIVTALGPVAATLGLSNADLLERTFKGTGLEGVLGSLTERPYAISVGNGHGEE